MSHARLSFEERKTILKWHFKFENVVQVQCEWRREFATEPPTRLTIARIVRKFETHCTVCNVNKGNSGRRRTSTNPASSATVLEHFTRSPQKSTTQCARETEFSRTSKRRILKAAKWKCYTPRLMHAMNEDDPDRRIQYCEWFQHMVGEDEEFVKKIVWSDEAQFKLNGTVNRHNCVYWAPNNPRVHVDKAVNLPGVTVWCGLSSRGLIGPFFFEGSVNGQLYLEMLRTTILPAINVLYNNDEYFLQQDGAPAHYHRDVRAYLDDRLPGHWIGRRGAFEFPARSPDLTPLDFYLWGTLKDVVYRRKPATIAILQQEIVTACAAITLDTLDNVVRGAVHRTNQCLEANGNHFEHL